MSRINKGMEHKTYTENTHILLRQAEMADSDAYVSFVTQANSAKYSPFSAATPENAKRSFELLVNNYDKKTYNFWTVIDKTTDQYAGFAGNHPVVCNGALREMFFMRMLPDHWKKSTPAQVAYLNCDYAFRHKPISEMIAFIHPYDSAGLLWTEQLNFKFEQESPFFGVTFFLFSIDKKSMQLNTNFLKE